MIGSGSLEAKLSKTILALGLHENTILTGDLEHSLTLDLLSMSSCYVRVSRYDGDCISLKEALHMGIPAVVTDTGLRPEGAILVRIGDEDDLLEHMIEIVSNPLKPRNSSKLSSVSDMAEVEKILLGLSNASKESVLR
jgi:glycosyltransferase involved in cell wall biosynthesis